MNKLNQDCALDAYFSAMLTVASGNDQDYSASVVEMATVALPLDFALPEPDASGSLHELDQLLGSVIDIELDDIDKVTAAQDNVDSVNTVDTVKSSDDRLTEQMFAPASVLAEWKNIEPEAHFQALFFEVAGVSFAVPLTELGGIYQTQAVTNLFGKPDWFLGIMLHRERKLNVVDTAQWVMPEQNMGVIDYKYQIQLSDSNWVLGCEKLHGNETLHCDDIKWRTTAASRPWLAGMVKSRICVLLHVTEMIKLLDNGINVHG